MAKINIMALGGLDENHKNMYLIEVDAKIFIFDAGVYEPLAANFGIQHFIPTLEYIEQMRDRVKGIFLTSGNRQENGALSELVKIIPNLKIYGSRPTIHSLKVFFDSQDWDLNEVSVNESISFGDVSIETRRSTSSMPGTFAWIVKTEDGNILYQMNSIFDHIPEFKKSEETQATNPVEGKTLMALIDSKNLKFESSISPKYKITKPVMGKMEKAKGRTIAVVYEEEIMNITELINLAKRMNRKVTILDDSIKQMIEYLMESKHIEEYPVQSKISGDKNEVIIYTGTRTTLFKKLLATLIEDEDTKTTFAIREDDLVIMAAPPQAGNEHVYQKISNEIARLEPELVEFATADKPALHPSQFDVVNMMRFIKPQAIMPVKGYYKEQILAANVARDIDLDPSNVVVADNGDKVTIENGKLIGVTEKVKTGSSVIELSSDGEIDSRLITERETLAGQGLVTIGMLLNEETKELLSEIDIQMKGVVFVKTQDKLLDTLKTDIKVAIEELHKAGEWKDTKIVSLIKKQSEKTIRRFTNKNPLLIIDIHETKV